MRIIGANLCIKPTGYLLRDAGACLIDNGLLRIAIAEERLTRKKHDNTLVNSINYCLLTCGYTIQDIDYFVFSLCGAKAPNKEFIRQYLLSQGFCIPIQKILVCPSHHLSHAASAFYPSGFRNSLIMVADRDGSVIDGDEIETYYANSVERISYYLGDDLSINLIEREEDLFGDVGLGLGYSYVTEWLGFDGHAMAGKTMALAAYGQSGALSPAHFYGFINNKICCHLEPTDNNKSLSVRRLIYKSTGIDIGAHCLDTSSETAFNVSRLIQDDLENVVLQKLRYLKRKTGAKNLCLAGGVALNCRMNYFIHKSRLFDSIFIQPAAGDTGQCLGNALFAYHTLLGKPRRFVMENAYYGKRYTNDDICKAISRFDTRVSVIHPSNLSDFVSTLLMENKIIGWFQGKSEFGPRALGNRSILASPLSPNMREHLNAKVKHREWFRPFGVSVIKEDASTYFDITDYDSPYMLIAPQTFQAYIKQIPSAVHVDGSCRLHTVDSISNERLYSLLQSFKQKSGVPILINTSFNIKGEPIVETPEDALNCFVGTDIDYLVLNEYVIAKRIV